MSWFSDMLGGSDVVPDGRGGYVPASNSRYDPATGRFLDAAATQALMRQISALSPLPGASPPAPSATAARPVPIAPAVPSPTSSSPLPGATPLPGASPRSVDLDDDSEPVTAASATPLPGASPQSALARAEAMPVNLPPQGQPAAQGRSVSFDDLIPAAASSPPGAAQGAQSYTDVRAPDGTIARFPADMSDTDILAVMKRHYPPPAPSTTAKEAISFDDLIPDSGARAAPASGVMPAVASTLRAINEGIPFSDRIVAGAKSLPIVGNGQSYAGNLAQEQAARAQLTQAHPLSTAFARGVGGLLTAAALPGASVAEAGLAPALEAGMRTGAAYGAAQGVSDQPDLNNAGAGLYGAAKGGAQGATLGTVFSGLRYGAGKGVSALADRISNGQPLGNSGAANRLLDAYQADRTARAGGAAPDYGPQDMVLDNGPAMLQLAKQTGGTPQGASIQNAVTARNNNFDSTISQSLPGIIGPDQSALAASMAIKAERASAAGPLPSIFENAPPITGISDTIDGIDARLAKLPIGSPEAQALQKVYNFLAPKTDVGGGRTMRIPVTDAETLDNAKRAVDGMINFGDPSIGLQPGALASKNSSLKMVAGGINQTLRDQVPNYGRTMDARSTLARQNEGIQYGQGILNTGKNAVHPDDSALKLSGMSPEESSAVRAGTNSEIYRRAGTSTSGTGLDALNSILSNANQTGFQWNAAKLGQLFEPSQVDALTTLQRQGNQFRTAAAAAGAAGNAATGAPASIDKRELANASIDAALTASGAHWGVLPAVYHGLRAVAPFLGSIGAPARNTALANALTSSGAAKDSIANAMGELLARRAAGQQMGSALAPVFTGAGLGAFDN